MWKRVQRILSSFLVVFHLVTLSQCSQETVPSCREFQNEIPTSKVVEQRAVFEDSIEFRCRNPNDVNQRARLGDNFKALWLYNCNTYIRQSSFHIDDGYPKKLILHHLDFYDPGNYTCGITSNGTTEYIVQYSLCVLQKPDNSISLSCGKSKKQVRGSKTAFNCSAGFPLGATEPGDFSLSWWKGDKKICENDEFNKKNASNNNYACEIRGNNHQLKCKSGQNFTVQKPSFSTQVLLNVSSLDEFGNYTVVLNSTFLNWSKNYVIHIAEDTHKKRQVTIATSVVVVAFVLLLSVFLVWHFYLEICILRKRLFARNVKDDKEFAFFLLYDYLKNEKDSKNVERIVKVILKKGKNLGYNYFDENTSNHQTCVGEVLTQLLTNNIKNSHAMIIVVTSRCIENKMKRFQAEVCVSSSIPIIFIFTKGSKKLMNQDSGWGKVSVAAKVSYQVKWTPKMDDAKLAKHIENALPKLHRSSLKQSKDNPTFTLEEE